MLQKNIHLRHINQQQLMLWSQNMQAMLLAQKSFPCLYPAIESLIETQAYHNKVQLLLSQTKLRNEETQLSVHETVLHLDKSVLRLDKSVLHFHKTVIGFLKSVLRNHETKSTTTSLYIKLCQSK